MARPIRQSAINDLVKNLIESDSSIESDQKSKFLIDWNLRFLELKNIDLIRSELEHMFLLYANSSIMKSIVLIVL